MHCYELSSLIIVENLFKSMRKGILIATKAVFHMLLTTEVYVQSFIFIRNHAGPSKIQKVKQMPRSMKVSLNVLSNGGNTGRDEVPSFIQSIVLKQVYPAMMKHIEEYGNPNIPLGTIDGKRCKVIRRLAFEQKLNDEEIRFLDSVKFRFNSLEDVYEEADFDECLDRLVKYEQEYKTNFQIPKKFKQDPELGAWVTMIRRIGRDNIASDRREKLDLINFAWSSTRKCGSAFMSTYRPLKERLQKCCVVNDLNNTTQVIDKHGLQQILCEDDVKKWIHAQAEAARKGNLSGARCDYMDQLPGFNWREM